MKMLSLLLACTLAAPFAGAADGPVLEGPPDCLVFNPMPLSGQSVAWDGPCKDGYGEGNGTLVWRVGEQEWTRYQGPLRRGLPHGEGRYSNAYGVTYTGQYVDGKRDGRGIFTAAEGVRYEGGFKDSRFEGQGSIVFRNKARYEGQFRHGARHGRGRAMYVGGQVFEGEFVNGEAVDPKAPPAKPSTRQPMVQAQVEVDVGQVLPARPYASLTSEEQDYVRGQYALLHRTDEPAYPLRGIETISRNMLKLAKDGRASGSIALYVQVDARGNPLAVNRIVSTDPLNPVTPALSGALGDIVMKEKFKPALCAGKPCAMEFLHTLVVSKTRY